MEDLKDIKTEGFGSGSTLWNFENLRGSENYKPWSRKCKNALQTMGVWHACVWPNPDRPEVLIEVDGKLTENPAFVEWGVNTRLYNNHSRIARGYIYNKLDPIPADLVDDLDSAFDVWSVLQQQYSDVGFTARHTTYQKLVTTTLASCNNDLSNFIVTLRSLQRDLRDMGYPVEEWTVVSNLLSNLDGHFKEYVSRAITSTNLPSFEEIAASLQELDRMNKRDDQAIALRAQMNRGAHAAKGHSKGKGDQKDKEVKGPCPVSGCAGAHWEWECFIKHPHLREEWKKKKAQAQKKAREEAKKQKDKKEAKEKEKKDKDKDRKGGDKPSDPSSTAAYSVAFAIDVTPPGHNSASMAAEWFVDSGCTEHMTPNRDDFIEYNELSTQGKVFIADGHAISIVGKGTVRLTGLLPSGIETSVTLSGVLHVPKLSAGLFSTAHFTKNGGSVIFDQEECTMYHKESNRAVLHSSKSRNQYPLNLVRQAAHYVAYSAALYSGPRYSEKAMQLWHRRTGHLNRPDLIRLQDMADGVNLTNKPKSTPQCESCNTGKSKLKPSRRPQDPVYEKNAMFDSDLGGPIKPPTWDGMNYYCLKRDRATGLLFLYLYATKDEFFTHLKDDFIPMLKTQTPDYPVKRWRSDEGGEIKSKRAGKFFKQLGVLWEPSAPYAKQQNGVSERGNYTVMDAVRAILEDSGLPAFLWGEILKTVVYLRNRSPCTRLRVQHVTPYEAYFGKRPDLGHLRLIGCDAWLALSKERPGQKKLSPRGLKCKFLGYAGTNQYRLWNPVSRKVITARDVHFDESYMLEYPNKAYNWAPLEFDDQSGGEAVDTNTQNTPTAVQNTPTADIDYIDGGGVENSTTPQSNQDRKSDSAESTEDTEMTSNSEDSAPGNAGDVDMDDTDVGSSNVNPGPDTDIGSDGRILHPDPHPDSTVVERRPVRTRNPSTKSRLNEHWEDPSNWGKQASMVVNKGYYEDLVKASTLAYCRQATVVKDSDLAYDHDMNPEDDFRELIELAQAYSAKARASIDEEPLTIKEALSGPYAKEHKAALDAEMAAHKKMGTYERVRLSSVPTGTKILTSRVVFKVKRDLKGEILKFKARWCARGFEQSYGVNFNETYASVVKSMSYKTIFAITAKEDLDAEQMDIVTAFLNSVLKERIYIWPPEGFEEEGWVWILRRALYGLKQSPREWYQTLSTFLKSQGFERLESDHSVFINRKTRLIVPVYVDDLLIIGPRGSKAIKKLKQALGKRFSMTDLGPCHHYLGMAVTRDREKKTLSLSQSAYIQKILIRFGMEDCKSVSTPMEVGSNLEAHEDYKATVQQVKEYQAIVGSLIYLWTQTRPDISFAVQKLARYNLNPSEAAMAAAKRVLRYLKGTQDYLIVYGYLDGFVGYTDADHAGDLSTRRSTGAYLFTLHGGAVTWSSKLQTCVALSSCEAEYMAQTQASKEAIWIAQLLKELDLGFGLPGHPVTIKADNQGAIALAGDPKFHSRTKHIDVQWHYVREQVDKGAVQFEYCPTNEMAADGLTKPLDKVKFNRFVGQLGLRK